MNHLMTHILEFSEVQLKKLKKTILSRGEIIQTLTRRNYRLSFDVLRQPTVVPDT